MSEHKPDVDDLLWRPNDYLREEYGQFGEEVIPAVRTHDQITALLATLDQQETQETYDPGKALWDQLLRTKDRIEDDIRAYIDNEYSDE